MRRIQSTPRGDPEQLKEWLEKLMWTEVDIQAMPVGKLGWLVRGRPHDRASSWRVRIPGHPT
eukprot:4188366-Alexandrium_andersonii.AAC.1